MGITNERLEGLRNGNPLRDFVLDYLISLPCPERPAFIEEAEVYGIRDVPIAGLETLAKRQVFFDRFYPEIQALLHFFCSSEVCPFAHEEEDLKSAIARFGFEETLKGIVEKFTPPYEIGESEGA